MSLLRAPDPVRVMEGTPEAAGESGRDHEPRRWIPGVRFRHHESEIVAAGCSRLRIRIGRSPNSGV
ncbi:MAG: hypothetical protein HQL50_03945 [Magnetococcales bacterium]|nr:hypothetical protein [Magnetococcales bacterium]